MVSNGYDIGGDRGGDDPIRITGSGLVVWALMLAVLVAVCY